MSISELYGIFREGPPVTWYEFIYWMILTGTGLIILFRPTDFFYMTDITIPGFLRMPPLIGGIIVLGAPNLLVITHFGKSVMSASNGDGSES